jgi:ketosteroid isomerase-like protein
MSQENVELVQRIFEAVGRGDLEAAADTLDPDIEIVDFDIPDAGFYHGREGFFAWLARWDEGWESWKVEDLEFRSVGDAQVLALFRIVTKGKGSGIEMDRLDAIAYRLRDGKVIRSEYFNDRQQALEAVGLRE